MMAVAVLAAIAAIGLASSAAREVLVRLTGVRSAEL